ncbi:MAG: hypothetical protein H7239_01785 [Flavobacterium sp.]|nr:hypothetical protein [Flavobacterium sp.]
MITLKNVVVGFLVSFVGSIPLGYLNIIGYEIYTKKGLNNTIQYLIGVVIIEAIVIYATVVFAALLTRKKQWMKWIEVFTIFFLLLLASTFFINNDNSGTDVKSVYTNYLPLVTGIILSSLNFIQIPFWTGWNLYLINNKYITIEKFYKYFYLTGTLFGTFFGMLSLILGLYYFSNASAMINPKTISKAIPIVFFGLAVFQIFKFYRKYYSK